MKLLCVVSGSHWGTHSGTLRSLLILLALPLTVLPALAQVGTVWAWGYNESGQLGDGTTTFRSLPVQSGSLTQVVAVSAGFGHSLALRSDGTVWAWGRNAEGQLGDGTTQGRLQPAVVPSLSNVVAVSAGLRHSLALRTDGTVWAWGYNLVGQLGDGTTTNRLVPVQVSGLTHVVGISAGRAFSLALRADGTVWAWGVNSGGELGIDTWDPYEVVPVQVLHVKHVVQVAAGGYHALALTQSGHVWAWGSNSDGRIGDGTNTQRRAPVLVQAVADAVKVRAGEWHSIAVHKSGEAWAWGNNLRGQLGVGNTTNSWVPVTVSGLTDVAAIDGGYHASIAAKADGTVWMWGRNNMGQLGDGSSGNNRLIPVQTLNLGSATDVSTSMGESHHSLAVVGMKTLSGTIHLQDVASSAGVLVTIEVRPLAASAPYLRRVIALPANGAFHLKVPFEGNYDVSVKGPHWLRHTLGAVSFAGTGASGLAFNLVNGDVNGDNVVNIADFLDLRQAYGSNPNSGNWNASADLNRDGSVGVADFLILRKNLGRSGDA